MFGKNKTTTTNTRGNASENFSANTIQDGTVIEGKIISEGSIRIDGKLNGTITTKAKLVVGKSGVITGDVKCQSASIEGRVEGDIIVTGLLDVKPTGVVDGKIVYGKLVVEEGAKLLGTLSIGNTAQSTNLSGKGRLSHKKAV